MGMIILTRKRRRKRNSKQVNLQSQNVHKRIEHPELYGLLRNNKLLLMNLD